MCIYIYMCMYVIIHVNATNRCFHTLMIYKCIICTQKLEIVCADFVTQPVKTTFVIHVALLIYSCVTDVTH